MTMHTGSAGSGGVVRLPFAGLPRPVPQLRGPSPSGRRPDEAEMPEVETDGRNLSCAARSAAVRRGPVGDSWSAWAGTGPCPSGRRMVLIAEVSQEV